MYVSCASYLISSADNFANQKVAQCLVFHREDIKVRFFIDCTNISNHYEFLNIEEMIINICIFRQIKWRIMIRHQIREVLCTVNISPLLVFATARKNLLKGIAFSMKFSRGKKFFRCLRFCKLTI